MLARSARLAALAGLLVLGACAELVGIQELETQPASASSSDGGRDAAPEPFDSGADAGSDPSVLAKRVFVTSETTQGRIESSPNSGTEPRVDPCRYAAARAGLEGEWVAWLSTEKTNAIDQLLFDGPYERLDGVRVVSRRSDLARGALMAPINVTEEGVPLKREGLPDNVSGAPVWTGTLSDGRASELHCFGWTALEGFGTLGSTERTDSGWTAAFASPTQDPRMEGRCDARAHLYCFEL